MMSIDEEFPFSQPISLGPNDYFKIFPTLQVCRSLEHSTTAPNGCRPRHHSSQALLSISAQRALSPAPESIQEDFTLRLQTQPEVGMSGTTHWVHPKTYKWDLLKTANQNQESHLKNAHVLIREL